MQITTMVKSAMEKIVLDIVEPLPKDIHNYKYILPLQCELSKFSDAYSLINKVSAIRAFVNNSAIASGRESEF